MKAGENLLPPAEEPKLLGSTSNPRRRASRGKILLIGGSIFLVLLLILLLGYLPRYRQQKEAEEAARRETEALPVANVVKVKRSASVANMLLPGTTTPVTEAYIYARASGYVSRRYSDIGDRVRQGQLLALIEAPDLDQQVSQARATLSQSEQQLQQAQASLENSAAQEELARVTWQRYSVLADHGAISRQEADQQLAAYKTAGANVRLQQASIRTNQENISAARANLDRLVVLQGFKEIRAPFTGVITARNFDVGALISGNGTSLGNSTTPGGGTQLSGSIGNEGTGGMSIPAAPTSLGTGGGLGEMYRIAQIGRLRILVDVPQQNAAEIHVGEEAAVTVQQFAGKMFMGRVTRTANALDPASRTLLTEVQVANQNDLLLPGMYSLVRFSERRVNPPLLIPGDSLVAGANGLQVPVLMDPTRQELPQWEAEQQQRKNGPKPKRIHMQTVEVGRDYGPQIEVINGLAEWEYVVVNPGDFAEEGTLVIPQGAPAEAAQAAPQRQGQSDRQPSGIGSPSIPAPTRGRGGKE